MSVPDEKGPSKNLQDLSPEYFAAWPCEPLGMDGGSEEPMNHGVLHPFGVEQVTHAQETTFTASRRHEIKTHVTWAFCLTESLFGRSLISVFIVNIYIYITMRPC